MLKLLKAKINTWKEQDQMRLLVWSVCLICFFGGFRIHEILSRRQGSYDPAFTLLGQDIKVVKVKVGGATMEVLQVLIKSPKEDRIGKDIIIDIYETKTGFCPVKYFKRWLANSPPISNRKPAFLKPCGNPLTGSEFNKIFKQLLSPHLDYSKMKISSHSFRGGMATLLGQLGCCDEEII